MKPRPIVKLRLGYYRQAVLASDCPACGATRGAGCISGPGEECLGTTCVGHDRCRHGSQVHLARLRAWTHVRVEAPAEPQDGSAANVPARGTPSEGRAVTDPSRTVPANGSTG